MRYCSNCNFANPDDIVLCLNCAAALALVCPICGEEAPSGSKFCGACGTRLPEVESPASPATEQNSSSTFGEGVRATETMRPAPVGIAASGEEDDADPISVREAGIIQMHKKNWEEAEHLLQRAAALSLRQSDAHSHGMALLELGRLYQRRAEGDNSTEWRGKALAAAREAELKFESIGAAYDLQAVRSLLEQLERQEAAVESARGPKSPLEGEWYQVSVVWLDLNQPQGTEDEALYESLSIIVPPLLAIAQENQGHIIRRQDGLTIIFGAPTPHEDDPVRAIQTAWRILQELRVSLTWTEVPITFRLAVTQGAAVGSQVRQLAQSELILRGQPLDLARRLAEVAPTSTVWVTPEIRSVTEHLFVYEPPVLDADQTETLASLRVQVSELRSMRAQPGSARGLFGIQTRLIGREHLLRDMLKLTRNLAEGKGGLIWLEGEAGIGKSRLMQEFSKSIATTSVLVWRGQCTPQTAQRSFSLFSNLLMDVFDVQPSDSAEQIHLRVRKTLDYWPAEAQAASPYLELLLGVKSSGPDGERLDTLEPDQLRQQTFVALRTLLKSMATQQPVILLLDDLHWIDPLSADVLLFLGYMVSSLPIFFVCAHRPPETGKEEERLQAIKHLYPDQSIHLPLNRLTSEESDAFLAELLLDADLPPKLRKIIIEQSDGNPYYIEEFIRMLIEQGYLTYSESKQWEVTQNLRIEELPLPTSLEALIRSRINTLPAELKQLLQYAAAIGRPFTSNLLKFITGLADPQEDLFDLERRGMLHRLPELSEWQFGHRLIESVVYSSMLKAQRKVMHLRVAFALEARWAGFEDEHAEELAYHFSQADESAKALSYLVLAGERASARSANEEALGYFQRAADLLASLPDTPTLLRWRLAVGLGDAYQHLGRYAEATTALLGGLTLANAGHLADEHRAGLYRRLGRTAQKQGNLETALKHLNTAHTFLANPLYPEAQAEVARILSALAWTYFLMGQLERAKEWGEQSLAWAERAKSLSELASAENILGGIYYRQSEWDLALEHTENAMALRERMGYSWGVAATSSNLGILAVTAGNWNKARAYFQQSLALREELGDVAGVVIAHNNLGYLARDQGRLEEATMHFQKSLELALPLKIAYYATNATLGLSQVALFQGDLTAAQERIDAALPQAEALGAQERLVEVYRVQAEIDLAGGQYDSATSRARKSAMLANELGNRTFESSAWRVVAEAALRQGDDRSAQEALEHARRALADATDRLEIGRVAALTGRLYHHQGEAEKAHAYLQEARSIFRQFGAALDLQRLEATVAQAD